MERTFAWLGNSRRLLIRWERLLTVYRSWFVVALVRLCLQKMTTQDATNVDRIGRWLREGGWA